MQKYLKKHFEHKFGNSDKLCTTGAREQVQRGSRNIVLNDARYKKKKKLARQKKKKAWEKNRQFLMQFFVGEAWLPVCWEEGNKLSL